MLIKRYLYFLLFFLNINVVYGHITLELLTKHASTLPEYPLYEGNNVLNPNYSPFLIDTYIKKSPFSLLSLNKFPFNKQAISQKLETLSTAFLKKEDVIYLQVNNKDEFIIMGVLYGSFHSLTRNLIELKHQGILDENLVLLKKNLKLIFMGDIIGCSAYSLETFLTVLDLMEKNPSQVFYMRGNLENHQNWMNGNFLDELNIKLKTTGQFDPFVQQINNFLSLLPSKIFLYLPSEKEKLASQSSYFVLNSLPETSIESLSKIKPNIDLLIQNQDYSYTYFFGQGLVQQPSIQGIPTWSLVSSSNPSFKKLFNYQQDAFYKVSINASFNHSTITHFWREIRSTPSAFSSIKYHLMSGRILQENEDYEAQWIDIPIICTLDLTESSKILGARLLKGMDLKIRQINREGGIHGKLLRVNFIDDEYTPSMTVKKVSPFLEKNLFTLFLSPLGTPTTNALISYLADKEYLMLFPYTGSKDLRQPHLKNIYHFRPSYADETKALIKHAKEKLFKQRFAFFYQDDSYGHSSLSAAKEMLLNTYKVSPSQLCEGSYMRNSVDINKAAEILEKCNPDILFFFSTIAPSQALINRLGIPFSSNITLTGISFLTDNFGNFLSSDKGLKFLISRIVPNPLQQNIKIVDDYQIEFNRWYPGMKYDVDSLEGYINVSLFAYILENSSPPYTKNNIIKSIENLNGKNFKGLDLKYNPETHEFSDKVWIDEFGNQK